MQVNVTLRLKVESQASSSIFSLVCANISGCFTLFMSLIMAVFSSIRLLLMNVVSILIVLTKTAFSTVFALFRPFKSPPIPSWRAPDASDVRSPCPGLNTLANHGIIPHSGRGLTIPMLQKALGDTYNIGLDVSTIFAFGGLLANPHFVKGSFDLSDIKKHNWIEHDVSLSRADLGVSGDAVSFRGDIWERVIGLYGDAKMTTIETAAKVRQSRVEVAKMDNPRFDFGGKQKLLSYGETALYLSVMGGLKTGVVPIKWVDIWFCKSQYCHILCLPC
jgi:hypothetical protein